MAKPCKAVGLAHAIQTSWVAGALVAYDSKSRLAGASMSDNGVKILIAICGLLGIVITSIVAPILKDRIESKKSAEKSAEARKAIVTLPDIMGTTWEAEWNFDDGTPYTKESVTFDRWTKDFQFEGFGYSVHDGKQYKYSITGLVSPTRIVALTWTAEGFPSKGANVGTACLELSPNSARLDGNWVGLAQTGGKLPLRKGSVTMNKVRDASSP